MSSFAFASQNDVNSWKVFTILRIDTASPETTELNNSIKDAILSNAVISLVDVSDVNSESIKKNAVWNGNNFDGGVEQIHPMGEARPDKKAVLSDSKLLIVFSNPNGAVESKMFEKYLNNAIKIIELLEDQTVAPGFVWDGVSFSPPQ